MEKEARVHMLPTNGLSSITKGKGEYSHLYHYNPKDEYVEDEDEYPIHLYITTDEEIKEGDWAYSPVSKKVKLVTKVLAHKRGRMLCYNGEDVILSNEQKVIATTDPKIYFNDIGEGVIESYGKLPQIPQSFIKEYCKAGGIDRVMVEVEEIIIQDAFKIKGRTP